jgi:hypothetical protein
MFALSVSGMVWLVILYVIGRQLGMFPIPAGDTLLWDRTGDALRSGQSPYFLPPTNDPFFYAPPAAVLFAALSWMPPVVINVLTTMGAVAALRLIAGSWRGAGVACWFPLVVFAVVDGNFNLIIAAGIVLAVRGDPRLAAIGAMLKLAPALVIRDWTRVVPVAAAAVVITVPWLWLWPEWIGHLVRAYGVPYGPQVPVPFVVRLALAVPLVLFGRGWVRALGAALAIPALYWGSLVILIAPLAVWARAMVERSTSPSLAVSKAEAIPTGAAASRW